MSDERLPQDVFDFFARRDANQPATSYQPVGPTPISAIYPASPT